MQNAADRSRVPVPDDLPESVKNVFDHTAIIMLTWNQREETRRCLESLTTCGYTLDTVVLWDNGSSDGTTELISSEFPQVIYHHSSTNLGVASGRNAAASLALHTLAPTHLMFLDNDMVVTPGFLEALCEPFTTEPGLAQTLAKIRFLKDPQRLQSAGGQVVNFALGTKRTIGTGEIDTGQYDSPHSCLPSGGATMVAARVFFELNGFDPIFDPYGTEDFDFSYRVHRAGHKALYVPSAVLYHDYREKLGGEFSGIAGFARIVERWLILLERHATLLQKLTFWVFSAPAKLLRSALREALSGNLKALGGVPRGMVSYAKLLAGRQKLRSHATDVGYEAD